MSGEQFTEVRLIPQFWKGDFVAYVNTQNMSWAQTAISVPAPYILDLFSLMIGVLLLRGINRKRNSFSALFLTLLLRLRPLSDILNNYTGFVVWNSGDFTYLADLYGNSATHGIGIAFSGIAIGVVWYIIIREERLKLPPNTVSADGCKFTGH